MHLASSLRAVVLAALCLAPVAAHANPASAWTAAKAYLPGDVAILGGVNVADLSKSSLVRMALPLAAPDIKKAVERAQKLCGVDLWTTIEAIVLAADAELDNGIVFVAVKGIDQAKINACAEADAKENGEKNPTATATVQGAITELSIGARKDYFMWIGKDVLAIPFKTDDKTRLEKWTPKKGALAKSKVGKLAAKVNTKASVWGASSKETELDGAKVRAGYGSVGMRGGNLDADIRLAFDSPATAKTTVDKINAELAKQADAKAIVDKLSITAVKDEAIVKAKLAESELMQAAGALMP